MDNLHMLAAILGFATGAILGLRAVDAIYDGDRPLVYGIGAAACASYGLLALALA